MPSGYEIGTYDASSLKAVLLALQDSFEIDSATFYRHYRDGDAGFDGRLSHRVQHVWADTYSEWIDLTDATPDTVPHVDEFARHVGGDLAHTP